MSGKRYWAVVVKQLLASIVLVFMLGFLLDLFLSDSDSRNPVMTGLAALGFYMIASLACIIINALSNALYLWLLSGDDMVDGILDEMRVLKLPPPRSDQHKDYEYLYEVVNDEEANTLDRVRAASFTGSYDVLMKQGIFRALSIRKALDAAVLRYAQLAPQR